jgi:polar amino acid transport system substrate-binding protein
MITRRELFALATVAVGAAACADRSGTTLDRAQRDGVLRVGLSGDRPFGYLDGDGRVTGSSPEVARAVLARMGVGGIEAVQLPFEQLIPALLAGQFDMIAAGMTILPERCTQVAFSRPDFVAPPAFVVPAGNPQRLRSFADISRTHARLAALSGSAELGYARAAGVADADLLVVASQAAVVTAVQKREARAGVLPAISIADALLVDPGSGLEATDPVAAQTRGRTTLPVGGFATRPADTDLRARFDIELTAVHASGEWQRIVAPFGFTVDNIPPDGTTTDALCAG